MEDLSCEGYNLEFVPVKASIESKTGITFKGKDGDYLAAQRMLKALMKKKGDFGISYNLEFIFGR